MRPFHAGGIGFEMMALKIESIRWKRFLRAGLLWALVGSCSEPAAAWYDCFWAFRTALTVTENSGGTLTNYQVPITISSSDFNSDYVWSSDGRDLRVIDSDDTTALDFFVESWDAVGETALIWVRFPTLVANSNRLIYF